MLKLWLFPKKERWRKHVWEYTQENEHKRRIEIVYSESQYTKVEWTKKVLGCLTMRGGIK